MKTELTLEEWKTVREAVSNLAYDVKEDPDEYSDGAENHLEGLLRKLPDPELPSKIYTGLM